MTQTIAPPASMSLTVKREELAGIIATASRIIKSRTPKPVLLCVKLVAEDNFLTVGATNLETGIIQTTSQIQLEHAGQVCVSAEKLLAILRAVTDDTVAIEMQGDSLQIKSGYSRHKLYTHKAEDFPPFQSPTENQGGEVSGAELAKALRCASVAMADDNTRYAFAAILLKSAKNKLEVVGTEGHVLALSAVDWRGSPISALLPRNAVALVTSVLEEAESVRLWSTDNLVGVKGDDFEIVANQVEGAFPPYDDIIPKDSAISATFDVNEMTRAVEQAALPVLRLGDGGGICRFFFSKSGVCITGRSPEDGESEVNLPCKVDGGTLEIGFNAKFVLAALKAAPDGDIRFGMNASNHPGVLRATNFTFVVMPVNLQ